MNQHVPIVSLLMTSAMALAAPAQVIDLEPVPLNVAFDAATETNGSLWLDFWTADLLVDGDRGNVIHGDGPGGVTGAPELPGFSYTIDLSQTVAMDAIALFPRTDCCPDRLRDFRVSVRADSNGGPGREVWSADLFPNEDAEGIITLNETDGVGTLLGRYVSVISNQSPVEQFELQLSEIEVYSGSDGERPVNYALRADVSTNGNLWSSIFSPSMLTDGLGNFFIHGDGPGGTTGLPEEEGFYYDIDLGQTIEMAEIHILPRQDGCCPERLSNYLVSIHEDDQGKAGPEVWASVFHDDFSFPDSADPEIITAAADPSGNFAGQWVRVTSLATQEEIDDGLANFRLQMSEVEVYGHLSDGLLGDYDRSGVLDAADIDILSQAVRDGSTSSRFDLNKNGTVDDDDRTVWVKDLRATYFGDSNLDTEFNSSDLVQIFSAGEYEDDVPLNSTWATGDWNGNGEFDSSDLIKAFTDGGYELGPPPGPAQNIPEPSTLTGFVLAAIGLASWRRDRRT